MIQDAVLFVREIEIDLEVLFSEQMNLEAPTSLCKNLHRGKCDFDRSSRCIWSRVKSDL